MFGWDCIFGSYIASAGSRNVSYSGLIQVIKSKTENGFIPNGATGGGKSQDRTEPMMGAKVLLEIYRKFGDTWLVELLFDDLLDWNNWSLRERTMDPLGLIVLGTSQSGQTVMNAMQNSRYESGLDDSPMYDCNTGPGCNSCADMWPKPCSDCPPCKADGSGCKQQTTCPIANPFVDLNTTCPGNTNGPSCPKMMMYDVGFTGMVTSEAQALITLAGIVGRPAAATMLATRVQRLRSSAQALWDPSNNGGVFTNKFAGHMYGTCPPALVPCKDGFYQRISPTSFYPMLGGIATDAQAVAMVENWLMSKNHFCISAKGDSSGNDDICWHGLPSIARSDPAFFVNGYWRGNVWGPMSMLVFWSLLEYDHLPVVRAGRKAFVQQMETMMLEVCPPISPITYVHVVLVLSYNRYTTCIYIFYIIFT